MRKRIGSITKTKIFLLGMFIILLAQVPMLILGMDAIVPYHDQLDGDLLTYMYQAKYLFSGKNVVAEFMNGMPLTSLTPPAPLAVLLFKVMQPFAAYVVMAILGQLVAYAGMFLLADRLTGYGFIAFVIGLMYSFLPFLAVYGFSQYGIPLLLVCFWNLWEKRFRWQSLLYIAVYAGMSSLVLCGYTWIILLGILLGVLIITQKVGQHGEMIAVFLEMTGIYLVLNFSLISQILGINDSFVSHKSEYVLTKERWTALLKDYFINGGDHSVDYHKYVIVLVAVVIFVSLFFANSWSADCKSMFRRLITGMVFLLGLCMAAALWNCNAGVVFREKLGSIGSFQFGRILWIAPAIWYAVLALCIGILWQQRNWMKWLGGLAFLAVLGIMSMSILKSSPVKNCAQEILLNEYETISWSDYFAIGVMEQVEEYIRETEGLEQSEYRVVSLGIDPVAALYHGFYTLDGYSNNYDVEHKHAFRKVIAPELERNEWLRYYYDDWGNRCYVFSAEIPGYYNIEKGSAWYNDLQINTEALKELGCTYILSAAYIVNAADLKLELLREDPFETEESYYRIYIYKLQ